MPPLGLLVNQPELTQATYHLFLFLVTVRPTFAPKLRENLDVPLEEVLPYPLDCF